MQKHKRTKAQALVEFALAATLIFTLLAAAIDLGLIFFTLQGLRNAAQEGATFGSFPEVQTDGSGQTVAVVLREDEIRERVSLEGGEEGIGFANLRDLNNDGEVDDDTVREAYIDVENLYDDPEDPGPLTECSAFRMRYQRGENCFIRVTVRYDYDIFFPLAPALDDTITIRASFMMPIRSTFLG